MSSVSNSVSDKIRSTFNFSVDKFPLSGPDGMSTPLYGLFRSDNSSLVGSNLSRLAIIRTPLTTFVRWPMLRKMRLMTISTFVAIFVPVIMLT